MRRSTPAENEVAQALNRLFQFGDGSPTMEQKLSLLASARGLSAELSALSDRLLIEKIQQLAGSVQEMEGALHGLEEIIAKVTMPPYFPAIYLGCSTTPTGDAGLVQQGAERRVVGFGPEAGPEDFSIGDLIILSQNRNFIAGKAPLEAASTGETATFVRRMSETRLVVKSREEELVVAAAGTLAGIPLRAGDTLRFDRQAALAAEKIERARGEDFFLESTPTETFADIGGLDKEVAEVQRLITLHLFHAEVVRRRKLRRKRSLLLHGAPGCGKTFIARALANWLAQLTPNGQSRFINVKPSALHSMWYSQSEANYRQLFRLAREAGEDGETPVVMFFDEIDSAGGMRGDALQRVDDRVLNAFMAELQGLEDRGNILVVAATNRWSSLDPALTRPGRLGDMVLRIRRPNRKAAAAIFRKHLPEDGLYGAGGREAIVEAAVGQIFAGNGESEVSQLTLRDGKKRTIRAAELLSGAEIAAIALQANETAAWREAEGGDPSLTVRDIRAAVWDFFARASDVLAPHNCRKYLEGLPQDVDVVRVEPIRRMVANPDRYLNAVA